MEYSAYTSEKFTRKVSLVVQAIDDFTGKAILGSNVRVFIEGEPQAIKKSDGYHVFVNLKQPSLLVRAQGGQYNSRSVECQLSANEDRYTFLKIRMLPNRSYPIPPNTTCIEGQADPGSLIRIFCSDTTSAFKLLYDYKRETNRENREISIFHPDDTDMEGKLLYIDNSGKNQEFMRVIGTADRENKKYLIEKGLSTSYKKIGTSLFSVYETSADQNGVFFLPIANTFKDKYWYHGEALGQKTVALDIELESGKVNHIDLR